MTKYLNNFCNGSPIRIEAAFSEEPAIGPTVSITQHMESMSFQHTMRPEQARELSDILLALATEAERLKAKHLKALEHTA